MKAAMPGFHDANYVVSWRHKDPQPFPVSIRFQPGIKGEERTRAYWACNRACTIPSLCAHTVSGACWLLVKGNYIVAGLP